MAFATRKYSDGLFCTYAVGKYSPPGNVPGTYKNNVNKGSFTPSLCNSLSTIADNVLSQNDAPVKESPQPEIQESFDQHAANQVLELAHHHAATFEPFKVPIDPHHRLGHTDPIVGPYFNGKAEGRKDQHFCDSVGTDNPSCRGILQNYIYFD